MSKPASTGRGFERLGAYALALALVATLLTGLVIGSDLRGCPRMVSHETCLEEAG